MPATERLRINRLHIKAVRGIPDLLLQLDGKGLILSGPNGSGKSSVVDSCEFLLLGSIGHLEGKQNLSLSKHGKHVHAQPSDMAVEFILGGNRALTRQLGGGPVCAPEAAGYLGAAQSRAFLLRRSQLLAFIHADPADRFRSLANLIGIEQLDELELTFKRVHDGLEGDVRSQLAQLGDRRRELQTLSGLGADKLDKDSLLEVVNTSLALVQRPAILTLEDNAGLSAALGGSEQAEATARKLIALEVVVARLDAAEASVRVLADAADLGIRVEEFVVNQDSRKALASRDVLAASENYLSNYSPKQCPVCDQLIEPDVVLAALKNKLQVLQELSERASALRVDASASAADLKALAATLHELKPSVTGDLLDVLTAAEDQATTFAKGFRRAQLLEERLAWPVRSPNDDRRLVDALQRSRTATKQAMEQLRPSDHERRLAETITKVVRIQQAFVQTTELAIALQRQVKYLARAAAVAGAIVAAKNDVVAEIFARLKADIDRFYEQLHPGEDHSNITLDVVRRASADLRIDSFGMKREDPRAFSSEAHLDSLGLCIFLAFAKVFSDACSLLILDDVVMSIDEGHRKRIAELLMSAFEDAQLIVTTHDRIWYKELVATERMLGRTGDFVNAQIVDWDVDGGPKLSTFKAVWEVAQAKLQANDLVGAGSDTRRNLEWVLQVIAERVQAPVPFQMEPRYTLDVLWAPVRQRLEKLVPDRVGANPTVLGRVEACRMLGNMLVHATIDGEALSKEEVTAFADAAKALHDWFCCAGCGALMWYDQQGKSILCRNPKCAAKTVWTCK